MSQFAFWPTQARCHCQENKKYLQDTWITTLTARCNNVMKPKLTHARNNYSRVIRKVDIKLNFTEAKQI